ncbi:hypothetical protein CEXT_736351 [Caerostris extrusa]|uniref:Uncharacterized protein n=1 Tax=Caerostris extrusa TaxID=172846 RepID=A0AAV4NUR3_CAEEX|nr:hypothetical protein CEXT_736351 [Caerostris extrusa]
MIPTRPKELKFDITATGSKELVRPQESIIKVGPEISSDGTIREFKVTIPFMVYVNEIPVVSGNSSFNSESENGKEQDTEDQNPAVSSRYICNEELYLLQHVRSKVQRHA